MKKTIKLYVDDKDNLVYSWKAGRNNYLLLSDWTYIKPSKEFNLSEELKSFNNDYDRVNKKFNIFRHDNDNYFYSDGNTDPAIIVSHFILEILGDELNLDLRKKYLKGRKITIVSDSKQLVPSNIKIGSFLLSDIIKIIFDYHTIEHNFHDILTEKFGFLLKYCDDSTTLDDLIQVEEDPLEEIISVYDKLTVTERKKFLEYIIEVEIK